MSLSRALQSVPLTMACPHCGHKIEKVGSWFQAARHYECEECRQTIRLRYDDKLKLFDDHVHLILNS